MSSDQNQGPSELDLLKAQATQMGIAFSPNIGAETLAQRIEERKAVNEGQKAPPGPARFDAERSRQALMKSQRDDQLALVRLRIRNLDPKNKDLKGTWVTVANKFIGNVTRYVPFGDVTENGWHVERCIYEYLKGKKYNGVKMVGTGENARPVGVELTEYSLDVLPPLTPEELAELAKDQRSTNRLAADA
jgi:hypothetical protein